MADSLIVKLGADTSEFRGQIAAASAAGKAALSDLNSAENRLAEVQGRAATMRASGYNKDIYLQKEIIHLKAEISAMETGSLAQIEKKIILETKLLQLEQSIAAAKSQQSGSYYTSTAKGLEAMAGNSDKATGSFGKLALAGRAVRGALSSVLGISASLFAPQIAEQIARWITGFSKGSEKELEKTVDLTEKALEETLKRVEAGKQAMEKRDEERTRINAEQAKLVWEARMQYFEEEKKAIKEAAEEQAKKTKDAFEEDMKWYKERVRLEKTLKEQKLASMTDEKRIVALNADIVELKKSQSKYSKEDNEYKAAQIEINEKNKSIEEARLNIAKEATKEIKSQNEEAKKSMTAAGDLGVARSIGGIRISSDPGRQYDYDQALIAAATRDNQREIETLQKIIDRYQQGGAGIGKFELPALMARLKALQSRRDNIRDYVFDPNYSDAAGQGIFASQVSTIGDPLGLQKKQTDVLQNVSSGVAELNTRLRMAGFGTGG